MIIVQMGDDYRTNGGRIIVQMGDALSYRWGTGRSLLPGRGIALGVLIITQMGDRHEVAALVDGHSIIVQMGDDYRTNGGRIIVQMGDGAKPLPGLTHNLCRKAILV